MQKATLFAAVLFIIIGVEACNNTSPADNQGEALSKVYCASCHEVPDPGLLDTRTWEQFILPRMGNMLGVYTDQHPRSALLSDPIEAKAIEAANIYPEKSQISAEDWNAIVTYYLNESPDQLSSDTLSYQILKELDLFQPKFSPI